MTAGTIIVVIVVILALIAVATGLFGARARKKLAAQYPPLGQMVDVGGYKMHLHCLGDAAASPTVVLDGAQGEPGLTWASVVPEVAEFARVCTYDRAGLGWSEASPKPRTSMNIVAELHTLLTRAAVAPPYVLVGHSMGGLYARHYAREHPDEVVGMILVDAAHEELDVRPPESMIKMGKRGSQMMGCAFGLFRLLNSIGLLALFRNQVSRMWFGPIPDEAREAFIGVVCSDTRGFEARKQEIAAAWDNLAAARAAQLTTLGDMPLVVLSRDLGELPASPGETAEEQFTLAEAGMQADLAALSTRGKHIIAEGSGHYIQVEKPELVVDAIREVVEAVRAQS